MQRRRNTRDPQLEALGKQIAAMIAADLTTAGYPLDWRVYGHLLGTEGPILRELRRLELEQATATYRKREEARASWAKEACLLSWTDLQAHWGLSSAEMR